MQTPSSEIRDMLQMLPTKTFNASYVN